MTGLMTPPFGIGTSTPAATPGLAGPWKWAAVAIAGQTHVLDIPAHFLGRIIDLTQPLPVPLVVLAGVSLLPFKVTL